MSAFKRTRAERFAAFASTSTQEAGEPLLGPPEAVLRLRLPEPHQRRRLRARRAGADGTLVLWDVTTGAGVRRVENAHADAATGLAARGGMVASCGYDGLAKLWDLRQGGARAARTWDHGTRCETIVAVPGATSSRRPAARRRVGTVWTTPCCTASATRTPSRRRASPSTARARAAERRPRRSGQGPLARGSRDGRGAALRGAVNAIAVAGGDAAGDARLLNRVLCVGTNAGLLDGRARDVSARRDDRRQTLKPPPGTFRHFGRGKAFSPGAPEGSEPLVVVGACVDDGRVAKRARAKLAARRRRPRLPQGRARRGAQDAGPDGRRRRA
ncbi:hypothetical protein JL720_16938 [Aureococcus anophagefferens]|nr:hypothetical protein JL720_16938 [Aureococcus anophagefferens]